MRCTQYKTNCVSLKRCMYTTGIIV